MTRALLALVLLAAGCVRLPPNLDRCAYVQQATYVRRDTIEFLVLTADRATVVRQRGDTTELWVLRCAK